MEFNPTATAAIAMLVFRVFERQLRIQAALERTVPGFCEELAREVPNSRSVEAGSFMGGLLDEMARKVPRMDPEVLLLLRQTMSGEDEKAF